MEKTTAILAAFALAAAKLADRAERRYRDAQSEYLTAPPDAANLAELEAARDAAEASRDAAERRYRKASDRADAARS